MTTPSNVIEFPGAPDARFDVTEAELADLGGFVRTAVRLRDQDFAGECPGYSLATRLTVFDLDFAIEVDSVMGVILDEAKLNLATEIGHCFPEEQEAEAI